MIQRLRLLLFILFATTLSVFAQRERVKNTPYIDQRRIHFGFLLGVHSQDLAFKHSGFTTDNGETWYAEIPEFSPGFTVGLLADYAFTERFNLRFSPNMCFGNKNVYFKETQSKEWISQDIKSNYLNLPLMLKYSAKRVNNYRPYLVTGFTPSFDISKRKDTPIVLTRFDLIYEVGVGCDIYLPFFKLIPELRFGFGLLDVLQHKRKDLKDPTQLKYTQSIKEINTRIVSLVFYFE